MLLFGSQPIRKACNFLGGQTVFKSRHRALALFDLLRDVRSAHTLANLLEIGSRAYSPLEPGPVAANAIGLIYRDNFIGPIKRAIFA